MQLFPFPKITAFYNFVMIRTLRPMSAYAYNCQQRKNVENDKLDNIRDNYFNLSLISMPKMSPATVQVLVIF